MVDRQGIIDHLRELEASLQDWEKYRGTVSLEDLKKDRDKRNMVLHAMLVAIQAAIDAASHIIAENRLRKPSSYREGFEVLAEGALLPKDMAQELADLAGFRNVLVHIYWRLNLDEVHAVLRDGTAVLQRFLRHVKGLLQEV